MDIVETDEMRTRNHRSARRFYRTNFAQQRNQSVCPRWHRVLIVMMIVVAGNPHAGAEELVNNLHFPGHYYDEESGLYYNWNRYYNPKTGRYITSDPVGLSGGVNLYGYAYGNPVNNTDAYGLWVKRCARKLGDMNEPPVKPSGNPLRHDYISVSGKILSFQAGDSLIWSRGRIDRVNEYPENEKCLMVCEDDVFDRYVLDAAKTIGVLQYCVWAYPGTIPHALGARNCQTWADDVLELAKIRYKEGELCPLCFQ